MNMRTLAKLLGGGLLLAGIVVIVQERSALARTRVEREELLGGQREAEQLRDENGGLEALRAANVQLKQLEHDNRDLPKLRNDVRRLREQAAEAASLRADNERLTEALNRQPTPTDAAPLPPDFIPRAGMRDLGLATPEAAVQTYLNAQCNGDVRRREECEEGTTHVARDTRPPTPEQLARQQQAMQQQTASFTGYRIADKRQVGPDRVDIDVQGSVGGAILHLHLRLKGNEWTVRP
jgi:hypothetical protein